MSAVKKAAPKWTDFTLLAFDLETTGISVHEDRIVTAALWEVPAGGRPTLTSYVVDPGIPIPAEAAAVHGYTREKAIAEQTHTHDQALFEIAGRLAHWMGHGGPVVGFNLAYDFSLFEVECQRWSVDGLVARLGPGKLQPVIDAHVLDKQLSRRRGKRTLTATCEEYGVRHMGAHDAGGDALASARLFRAIVRRYPEAFPEALSLGRLHQQQVGWRAKQMDGLRAYFDRSGIEHDGCDGGWPLHTTLTGARAA